MPRYQLRLRPNESLADILDGCVEAVWKVLSANATFASLGVQEKTMLRDGFRRILGRYIGRSDVCGAQSLCEESMEPAAWNKNPDPALAPRHPWESEEVIRLAVNVAKGLEDLIDSLEAAVYRELFKTPERAHQAPALKKALGQAVQGVLAPHLYRNVTCGTLELCRQAQRVDAWSSPELQH